MDKKDASFGMANCRSFVPSKRPGSGMKPCLLPEWVTAVALWKNHFTKIIERAFRLRSSNEEST